MHCPEKQMLTKKRVHCPIAAPLDCQQGEGTLHFYSVIIGSMTEFLSSQKDFSIAKSSLFI